MAADAGLALAIAGVKGRMGRQIAALALGDDRFSVLGGTALAGDADIGKTIRVGEGDVGVFETLSDLPSAPSVIIDFTAPDNTVSMLKDAVATGSAMVIGTTGFTDEQEAAIADAATKIAIVKAGNMSLGVNLLTVLVEKAAASLGPDFDIEIHEAHHRFKKDAPSGTALMLGEAAASGRGIDLKQNAVHAREGQTGERPEGAIGFSVTRAGGIIGEHDVSFGSQEELITLSHSALDRAVFARGALTAAAWAVTQEPGLYDMRAVLGL